MQFKSRFPHSEAAIVGASCRVPGARSLAAFWQVLAEGRNTVSPQPNGRWSIERFLRRGNPEPGFTYTFAGGYLDDPLEFDPAPFGISPREAAQMDPQQRLLLELVWEALEDGFIPPSRLAGANVGVYVGASMVDYQTGASHDPAVMESHFMTGNSLSILSNRISYAFDFHGPSFTVDSACSSSFVALRQALEALESGRIDYAVVGGVNMLLSPAPYIGFSQARMLSPTGLSRPFSAKADGYVRSEGGVVVVLQRTKEAVAAGAHIRGYVCGAAINSDGRTVGISLPSLEGQRRLIESFYGEIGLQADKLAFVEAHGTGTAVGDPIEAHAIGQSLGRRRGSPLPIGSVKSNIGHLEAASGLAALLKSVLALEKGVLPKSLFLDEPNPHIDFAELNLLPNAEARPLELKGASRYAAICNYGFGGTNAHVLVRGAEPAPAQQDNEAAGIKPAARQIIISAADPAALAANAERLAGTFAEGFDAAAVAGALGHGRELLKHRLVIPVSNGNDAEASLRHFAYTGAADERSAAGIVGTAEPGLVFVYSGNGCQFADMGRQAHASNAQFRREIAEIDRFFLPLAGWSIGDRLKARIAESDLAQTSISQPLIYAIQSALTGCFAEMGIHPDEVIGHSVGEVAAAEAAGALSRKDAVQLIFHRSRHQEAVRGLGRMLVVAASHERVGALLAAFGKAEIEIAAHNGAGSTTVSGVEAHVRRFAKHCRAQGVATVLLDVDYPFHSSALDSLREGIVADLAFIRPKRGKIRFISTVTGHQIECEALDAAYWWQNLRQPVLFHEAVHQVADQPGKLVVEISPRPILTGPIGETFRAAGIDVEVLASLAQKDEGDAVGRAVARLIANGAKYSREAVLGARPARLERLPGYAFQHQDFNLPGTAEAHRSFGRAFNNEPRHPLLGNRQADGSPEWRQLIDPVIVPYLTDHRVDNGVVVPASGLIEMALAAGRDLFGERPLELDEFDILKALSIAEDETREVSTRYAAGTSSIEIWSRRRFSAEQWLLHARGRIAPCTRAAPPPLDPPREADRIIETPDEVYAEATRAGLDYGPMFRRVVASVRDDVTSDLLLAAPEADGLGAFAERHLLHPVSLDAAFHGLFVARPQKEGERKAHLPVRFRKVAIFQPGAIVRRSITLLTQETDRFKTVTITLMDERGTVVAAVEAAVLRALHLTSANVADRTFRVDRLPLAAAGAAASRAAAFAALTVPKPDAGEPPAAWLVMRAFTISLADSLLRPLFGNQRLDGDSFRVPAGVHADAVSLVEQARAVLTGLDHLVDGRLPGKNPLPPPGDVLATLMAHFPAANFEIRLAASALAEAGRLIESGARLPVPPALADLAETSGLLSATALAMLADRLGAAARAADRPLRLLMPAPVHAGLVNALLPLITGGSIVLTALAADRKSAEATRQALAALPMIDVIEVPAPGAAGPARFDGWVALASGAPQAFLPPAAAALLQPGALVAIARPGADAALDFLCSLWAGWSDGTARGLARIPERAESETALAAFGAEASHSLPVGDGLGALLVAAMPEKAAQAPVLGRYGFVGPVTGRLGEALVAGAALCAEPGDAFAARLAEAAAAGGLPERLFVALPAGEEGVERLAVSIECIKTIAEAVDPLAVRPKVTLLAEQTGNMAGLAPIGHAMRGFLRVAINEFPNVDLGFIELAADVSAASLPATIAHALAEGGDELELAAAANGFAATRIRKNLQRRRDLRANERALLRFEQQGRLDSFSWVATGRPAPGEGEIEIEVAAVALNFRDVMVGLGILDDDLLGAGLTAAALGFECSGRVTRLGPGVTHLKVGDPVTGFAANTFASHLVSPAWHFFKVPAGMSLEAAATIPVAFATAWFSLVTRGRIGKGDDVLIHGGAGGVGLAAIQIAKLFGARVLATASSAERRAIARAMGADLTYDSRQERFAEAIREEHGGVDVVLNSLAGPAMAASFKLVKPFGRFLELGKRDYLDNTHLALRPFVRNIAYFGVDLDELLAHDRAMVEALMADILARFESGALQPLPYRVLEAHEVGQAFRSMQASEHVGKILVRPARRAVGDLAGLTFRAREDGAYLVVGGTAGLGFATGRWLAKHGAGTIVLASRRGALEEGLEREVAALRKAGKKVLVEALDVTDGAAASALVARIAREHGALRGIVHAAVLLDDGLIASLTPDRLRAVLRPKLDGAINLDKASSGQPLDFFVVYSSATTVIGSPGQGAYVAANAWLEGFAAARRAAGKPGLAVGWGAIDDVGIIARDKQLGRRLARTTGVVPLSSYEALAHLGRLLALGEKAGPIEFYTNIAAGAAADKLKLLKSPAFVGLGLARADNDGGEGQDLAAAIEGKSRADATALIATALKREIALILRVDEQRIDIARPLGELGLDSLMALELQMAIERLAGTDVPLVGAGDRKLREIAGLIYSKLRSDDGEGAAGEAGDASETLVAALGERHTGQAISDEDLAALKGRLRIASGGRRG